MSQYFSSSNKRGELNELHEELNNPKTERKREALKKVIAHMTIGKDVSPLFQSVIKCLEVNDLEIIKLVYLYIINYSRTKPDDAIMVVERFRKGTENKGNSLIRALAVRTMGCIRVKKINEYLIEPLKKLLNDEDPYVKKTAIMCVPKVYEITPDLIEKNEIIQSLERMLQKEGNSWVLSNLVSCLNEISAMKGGQKLVQLNYSLAQKLLLAINECIEWGQIAILDFLQNYQPEDAKEAENIIDRVIPRLSHVNSGVVISSLKLIINYMDFMTSEENIKALSQKITASLVSLVKQAPEIQWVTLKNISFIIEKRPHVLDKQIKVFYVDFNDPYYVKIEKLDVIVKLADNKNYENVIRELAEYVNGIDQDFGRRALKAIGKICLKLDKAAEKCISVIKAIVKECSQASHILAEAAIVFQIIYRKYPEKFIHDEAFQSLASGLEQMTEPEPRGSLIWLVGEFATKIPNSVQILTDLTEYFLEEPSFVQLQILSACVKLYLLNPTDSEDLIATVLPCATENNDNPDVRDRGYIYWRMLSTEPEKAKKVVLSDRPLIVEKFHTFEDNLLNTMVKNIGTIASVFYKDPETFIPKMVIKSSSSSTSTSATKATPDSSSSKKAQKTEEPEKTQKPEKKKPVEEKKQPEEQPEVDLLDMDDGPTPDNKPTTNPGSNTGGFVSGGDDLLDMDLGGGSSNTGNTGSSGLGGGFDGDLLCGFGSGGSSSSQPSGPTQVPSEVILEASTNGQKGNSGIKVDGSIVLNQQNQVIFKLNIHNQTMSTLSGFNMQIKPNYFGMSISGIPQLEVHAGQTGTMEAPINFNGKTSPENPSTPFISKIGFKNNLDTFYFNVPTMFHNLLTPQGEIGQDQFKQYWKEIPDTNEISIDLPNTSQYAANADSIKQLFRRNHIYNVTERKNDMNQTVMYFTACSVDKTYFLSVVSLPSAKTNSGCTISCKSHKQNLSQLFLQAAQFIATSQN